MSKTFSLHTTKKVERDLLVKRKGKKIKIDPFLFHKPKAIVWEEDTQRWYEHEYQTFHYLLKEIERDPKYDYHNSEYYKKWISHGSDINTRLSNLPSLFQSIKESGVVEPVHCEITGERLDGAYRTKIAMYLGIKEVPAVLHKFRWQDITEDFIERKLKTRWLAFGKDYYEFYFNEKWKNIPEGGEVYKENALDRWNVLEPLITGKSVLDLGCNEGYMSLQCARKGLKVVGIDMELIEVAYLNKLIYEFVDKKDIKAEFYHEHILDTKRTADTILFLNVLYHLPKDKQKDLVMRWKGKQLIFCCNLRKEKERNTYYTSHPDDLCKLLDECGIAYKVIDWRDKPFVCSLDPIK